VTSPVQGPLAPDPARHRRAPGRGTRDGRRRDGGLRGLQARHLEAPEGARGDRGRHARELWDAFARAVDADLDQEPASETAECAAAWTAAGDALEGLVILYTIESAQPAISRTKLDGLVGHYGFSEGPATEYFAVHAARDVEHAAQSRELIEDRLEGADEDRLVAVAEAALRANWTLLDGVERRSGR
jgi:pyrroloquinoline quinone (PQQ) biosynthesis protein C